MQETDERKPDAGELLGSWSDLAFEKCYGSDGQTYSQYDVLLRQEYRRALDGNVRAIRKMMDMLDANLKARDHHRASNVTIPIVREGGPGKKAALHNADLALLLLGIAAISDESLEQLGQPGDDGYEARLRKLAPDRLESWVLELGGNREQHGPSAMVVDCETSPDVRAWRAHKDDILRELMRVRGPGASRFQPGRSGNPEGRPRKPVTGERAAATYPHAEFFLETVEMTVNGRKGYLTRLDALMHHLTAKAVKGDEKISRLVLPRLTKLRELGWEEDNRPPRPWIVRG